MKITHKFPLTGPEDRRVHAYGQTPEGTKFEIVRYDRAGKWYCETDGTRRPIDLATAVTLAADISKRGGGQIFWNRVGGTMFDSRLRKALR